MWIFIFLLFLIFLMVWKYFIWPRYQFSEIDKLPGPPKHWLWGSIHLIPTDQRLVPQWSMDQIIKYGPVRKFWAGPSECVVMISGPEDVKTLLTGPNIKKSFVYRFLQPWLGNGLLLSTGSEWQKMRKLLTPAFHYEVLEGYCKVANEQVDIFLENISKIEGKFLDITNLCTNLTLDVIGLTAFSTTFNAQRDPENAYVLAISEIAELIRWRVRQPWFWNDFVYSLFPSGLRFKELVKILHKFTMDVVDVRMKKYEEHNDFLDILLKSKDEEGSPLTKEQILAEVDTFMFEGHDTTAHALLWILYNLAINPLVQKNLQKELDVFFESPQDRHIDYRALKKLEYLNQVINESLRLRPSVPIIARELEFPMKTSVGIILPVGTTVQVAPAQVHRSPHNWENSLEFRPERFSKANSIDPFAFIPFSGGQRNCIGQKFAMNELLVTVARLLHLFSIEPDPDPEKEPIPSARLILASQNGFWLKFNRRILLI